MSNVLHTTLQQGDPETGTGVSRKWIIDPVHSSITFSIKHLMISNIRGGFKQFDAILSSYGNDPGNMYIDFSLNPDSIDTGDEKRDEHLKSPDFFDTAKFPQVRFSGRTYEYDTEKHHYIMEGQLSIKEYTHAIRFDVEFGGTAKEKDGSDRAGFQVNGNISRKDFGLNWNNTMDTGGVMLSDRVQVTCDIQLIKLTNQ